jgi:hypothetical protein
MALTTVSSNLVWQEAAQQASGRYGISQVVANQFMALKAHLAQTKGNPNLKLIAIDSADIDNASGFAGVDAACTLYGIFLRKTVTNSTDAYVYLIDDDTDDSGVRVTGAGNTVRAVLPFLTAQDQVAAFFFDGLPMATGLVVKAYTTGEGGVSDALVDANANDTPIGFAIVGDPL